MAKSFFTFPNPVNDIAARTVATGVFAMAVTAVATQQLWLTIPLAYGFVARVLAGQRLSPLGMLASHAVAPRLSKRPKLVPGPPKRFAQSIGAAFTLTAMILWLVGDSTGANVLLAILCVPTMLEAGFGYCVGCKLFAVAMRFGMIPTSVCEECADFWNRNTTSQRRAQVTS